MKNTSASLAELREERLSYVRISFARALPPPRLSAKAPSALAGTRARAPRGRASEATRSAQDINAGVSSICEGRIQEVVLFMALSSCLLRFAEGASAIVFGGVRPEWRTK